MKPSDQDPHCFLFCLKIYAYKLTGSNMRSVVHKIISMTRVKHMFFKYERTSDGGNGNRSVSLPIISIKIKVDQMLPSSYISSLLVSIL